MLNITAYCCLILHYFVLNCHILSCILLYFRILQQIIMWFGLIALCCILYCFLVSCCISIALYHIVLTMNNENSLLRDSPLAVYCNTFIIPLQCFINIFYFQHASFSCAINIRKQNHFRCVFHFGIIMLPCDSCFWVCIKCTSDLKNCFPFFAYVTLW